MRRLFLIIGLALRACTFTPAMADDIGIDTVCFVPGPDDCALVAAAEIAKAQKTLDVQEFQLTEPHVAQAILDAKNRGVAVRLLLDKKAPGERNGQTPMLTAAGIPAWVDFHPNIAHNKVIIVDDEAVISGSFNITTNANHFNSENLVILRGPEWAAVYEKNFMNRLAQSDDLVTYERH